MKTDLTIWQPYTDELRCHLDEHLEVGETLWIATRTGEVELGRYFWSAGRPPHRLFLGSANDEVTHVMLATPPTHPSVS